MRGGGVCLFLTVLCLSLFCYTQYLVPFLTEKERAGGFTLIAFCLLFLFLTVSWTCLQCVTVACLTNTSILYT